MAQQGCSPLLFALILEPLFWNVRTNPDIKGITVRTTKHKLSAYADDVLFHLIDPLVSLPNLMWELQTFGRLSNFKINYSKSEVLPITVLESLASPLREAFPFMWAKSSIKYLGIQLTD